MTCGRDDPPGYTCAGSGHLLGSLHCVADDHYEGCGQHFGSLESFDWHLQPRKDVHRCATVKELTRHGLHLDDRGVWKTPMDEVTTARLRAHGHPSVTQGQLMTVLQGEGL